MAHCLNTFLSLLAQDAADLSIPVGNERMVRAWRLCMERGGREAPGRERYLRDLPKHSGDGNLLHSQLTQ